MKNHELADELKNHDLDEKLRGSNELKNHELADAATIARRGSHEIEEG